jgi:hypothetical protein
MEDNTAKRLKLLPESEWIVRRTDDGRALVSTHENCGYRHYFVVGDVEKQ